MTETQNVKTLRKIAKRDTQQQLILSEIYVPDEIDSQNDFIRPATLEKLAHQFSLDGNHKNISVAHDGQPINAAVVESYLAKPNDPLFKEGSWIAAIKIFDPVIWNLVQKGELRGVSFEGEGTRVETTLNGQPAKEITHATIHTISLVPRAANRRTFTMTKADKRLDDVLNVITKSVATLQTAIASNQSRLEDIESQVGGKRTNHISKAEADVTVRNNADILYLLRKGAVLQNKHERIMERPPAGVDVAKKEAEIIKRIEKCEDELYALGYSPEDIVHDKSRSAFFHRGGVSITSRADLTGINQMAAGQHDKALKKAENEIDLNSLRI